jgi:hypothetical protein
MAHSGDYEESKALICRKFPENSRVFRTFAMSQVDFARRRPSENSRTGIPEYFSINPQYPFINSRSLALPKG